jgi:hypothetical protein
MTNGNVIIRGNISESEIKKIQDLLNKRDPLYSQVPLILKSKRFDANYISLGTNIIAAVASLLYIFLETKNIFKKRSDKDESRDIHRLIQQELSDSTHESVEVIKVSWSGKMIDVTVYESSQNKTISVKYSCVDNNCIIGIN